MVMQGCIVGNSREVGIWYYSTGSAASTILSDSDLEDVDDIMRSVFGDDEGADMDHSYDSEASSGDEGNSNDEANSDDDPMDVDSNVELFVYICVSSMCCFALQQLMLINIS